MPTLTIDEVQSRLPQIIDALHPGEELVITRGDRAVARLTAVEPFKGVPIYGRGKGKLLLDVEDESHLDDFAEYMP
jgi:antitoxin (DNA-binding transcriptional repressor) of toxin-antitoxin stability system